MGGYVKVSKQACTFVCEGWECYVCACVCMRACPCVLRGEVIGSGWVCES